jgi:hypothetical protein
MNNNICEWIGAGEFCRQPTIFGKCYCESHNGRVYLNLPSEMADYLINQEVDTILKNCD